MPSLPGQWPSPQFSFYQDVFGQAGIPIEEHQPYSPDLAPYDFFLFPIVKSALKGT
ncbi:hypothetical protein AVEN_169706-1, partial [Araneus ventricosus]